MEIAKAVFNDLTIEDIKVLKDTDDSITTMIMLSITWGVLEQYSRVQLPQHFIFSI